MLQKKYKSKNFTSLSDQINVHYYANFLTNHKADKYYAILEQKLTYNSAEESKVKIFGKEHLIPRQQVAYGDPGTYYSFAGIKVEARPWNDKDDIICRILKNIKHKVELFTGYKFNFVLINKYKDGDQYIGLHKDDEKELGDAPTIVGVSLGAVRDVTFKATDVIPTTFPNTLSLELEHGSIFVMYHPTNQYWKHSIPKRAHIKKSRISLTFRTLNKI